MSKKPSNVVDVRRARRRAERRQPLVTLQEWIQFYDKLEPDQIEALFWLMSCSILTLRKVPLSLPSNAGS